ncbi:nucleotidyltransferase domain-containing protein [Sphaerisporangium perillae]|uniref:nucleotidyltransferase domain-containing protein n=1 Tax=Sphaerisporangium perillae TaxID=2935860 RepID=UPI00200F3FA2|nr:nucleotidyltransferase [Sphaerisporangium perillae]
MDPTTIPAAFGHFDTELNLDPTERDKAMDRHQEITDVLTEAGIAASAFLQGSFARKTMPKPLKDVDMVILLPEAYRTAWFDPGKGGPAAAMARLRHEIEKRWPDARFDVDDKPAHALQVTFPDCSFTFDLVPAFADAAGGEDVFIADRELDRWERSNTRTLRRVVTERNQATGGVFVHQVRMGKAFKSDKPQLHDLCGLVIESLCYAAITKKMPHATAMVTFFEHAATAVMGKVMDPTGVDDLAEKWTSSDRKVYSQVFATAAARGKEALGLASDGEHEAAIEIWHSVFGDPFPAPSAQTPAQALVALTAGSITSTGRAVTSRRGVQPNRPARSWRTP